MAASSPGVGPRTLDRPRIVTGLSLFFALGAVISFTSMIALLFPGSALEPMWRLNPRAREAFSSMGPWAIVLMAVVCSACLSASLGLWRGKPWGYVIAVALLLVSLVGDLANAVLGIEPRAWVGVPIAALLLASLTTRRVRAFFAAQMGK
jgi:hypothetical protein